MSVHEGDRMDNRFTLPVKAEELARHTLIVTKNEKLFLPEYNEWITNKIRNYAIEAYLLIREANDLKVKVDNVVDPDVLKDRHDMQKLALRYLRRLLPMIDLARRVFHLSTRKVKFWSKMVIEVRDRTKGWMEDDMRRYSPR